MNSTSYVIGETHTVAPSNMSELFQLHNHEDYEIFLFFEGDARYIVENKSYFLEPYDMIIVNKNELHRVYHNQPVSFRRTVLYVSSAFFQKNNCSAYEQNLSTILKSGNKIPGSIVRSSGLYDAFLRYKNYSENYSIAEGAPVLNAIIIEILFLISKTTTLSVPDYSNSVMNPIILYLNHNYTEDLSLDMLQKKFFISKHYICREFRKTTGLTIFEYIRKKRLAKVSELRSKGMGLLEAAMSSGFNSYCSFYRAFQKEFGYAPSQTTTPTAPSEN